MPRDDTIAAIATASGAAGIGVIRLSGPDALAIAQQLTDSILQPRLALLRRFYDAAQQEIDHGVVLYFQGPRSFTGEDVVELQGHGGLVLQEMLLGMDMVQVSSVCPHLSLSSAI